MFMKRHRTHTRRGVAVVEMAVVAPLLIFLVLGTVEMGWMLMVRHTVSSAAREGARASTLPSATLAEVQGKVDAAMSGSGLTGYAVTSNLASLAPTDEEVWVEVTIPYAQYALTGSIFGSGMFDVTTRVTLHREGV